jgi:hypothetical protein
MPFGPLLGAIIIIAYEELIYFLVLSNRLGTGTEKTASH